ncbi:MAG: phenylacetate-CoA oxygenase subunit PaaJ [Gammaproteobacteria bacterium]|nr:phenylacetate-CoA oxygenase subunit PaaJ [Gammaproteobacteria bacterium]
MTAPVQTPAEAAPLGPGCSVIGSGAPHLDPSEPAAAIPLETPEYAARWARRQASAHRELYALLDAVRDPELPELSIWDLGVLREVREAGGAITVAITPTYSGCPALAVIREDIAACLTAAGCQGFAIVEETRPPWTTALLSRAACAQLRAGGVAPPVTGPVRCPVCGSAETALVSEFASTACKAHYRCRSCLEPFDHFKMLK